MICGYLSRLHACARFPTTWAKDVWYALPGVPSDSHLSVCVCVCVCMGGLSPYRHTSVYLCVCMHLCACMFRIEHYPWAMSGSSAVVLMAVCTEVARHKSRG